MPPRFRLPLLFAITTAVAILAAVMGAAHRSRYFTALASPHALLSFMPIAGVVVARWLRLVEGATLVGYSLLLHVLAMVVPALRLGGDMVFGCGAWLLSFMGLPFVYAEWGWGSDPLGGESFWYPIACTLGAGANLMFFVVYLRYLLKLDGRRNRMWAIVGLSASLGAVLSLALSTELGELYLGSGLWIASYLALVVGLLTQEPNSTPDRSA